MGVYQTDCGHEMEENDFFAFVMLLISDLMKSGIDKPEVIKKIWEEDYFADFILDKECFNKMKESAINLIK